MLFFKEITKKVVHLLGVPVRDTSLLWLLYITVTAVFIRIVYCFPWRGDSGVKDLGRRGIGSVGPGGAVFIHVMPTSQE